MKLHPNKCHILIFGGGWGKYGCVRTYWWVEEKRLGATLDKNLDVKSHVNAICKIAGQKLHALVRIASYMNVEKLGIMINTFAMSQFSYCPLIWMFQDRSVNKKINKI